MSNISHSRRGTFSSSLTSLRPADQFARPSGIIIITTSSNRRAHYDNYLFRSCGCRIYQLFGSGSIIQRRSFSAAVRRAAAERRTVDYPANDSQFPSSCSSLLLLLFLNKINDSASFDCRERELNCILLIRASSPSSSSSSLKSRIGVSEWTQFSLEFHGYPPL